VKFARNHWFPLLCASEVMLHDQPLNCAFVVFLDSAFRVVVDQLCFEGRDFASMDSNQMSHAARSRWRCARDEKALRLA
jgi:hypothetical protein